MNTLDKTKRDFGTPKKNGEERLDARAVSRGFAFGKVVCLYGHKRQFYRIKIEESQIKDELRRFRAAIRTAVGQLKKIIAQKNNQLKKTKDDIFLAHLLILEDKSLHRKIESVIEKEKVNAEWAVNVVIEKYITQYKTLSDRHLRERYIDLEDVADRLLNALGVGTNSTLRLEKNSIIVAKEVRPSTLVELADNEPQAIITENGGWTSHTFILAREMNLPALTGVKRILRQVKNGDEVIVDGFNGQIILHPKKNTVKSYRNAAEKFDDSKTIGAAPTSGKLQTLDGQEITIRANLDFSEGYSKAKRFGAQGIGLYRSEFLFNHYKGFPTEEEQVEAYTKIAQLVGAAGVRIRTFDLSIEQLAHEAEEREKNPALGLRAIRLSFSRLKQFRIQLRALLQAAAGTNISVVLPMISGIAEISQTKMMLQREKKALQRKKIAFGEVRIGAMIEVPSAVLMIDEIVEEVDFLCLGTNDLVQYLLAVDRDNESVADWFQTLHPAILRALKIVFTSAEGKAIPVIVCGEMAGSPAYVPILLGLGATELSMNVSSIARVRRIVSEIALEEAQELVGNLKTCRTVEQVESKVSEFYERKWSHLLPKDIFPPKKNIKSEKI